MSATQTGMITIQASPREQSGKGACRKIRAKGLLPANISNAGKSTPIVLDPKYLSRVVREAGGKFTLDFNGVQRAVSIQELQIEHVSRRPLHVDLVYAD